MYIRRLCLDMYKYIRTFVVEIINNSINNLKITIMKELEKRIFVSEEILLEEYAYTYGEKENEQVIFQYYNFTKDKEGNTILTTYKRAIDFARYRRNDRRYKNYEFLIYTQK